jgi:hypothetical protein
MKLSARRTKNVKLRKNESKIFYGVPTTNPKTMADERGEWLGAMVSSSVKGALPIYDGTAALFLDRRLMWTKGARIMSFVAGMAATFLQKELLPDCEVLRGVSGETLEQLDDLLFNALPDFRARAAAANLLFRSTRDGATAATFHAHCDEQGPTLTLIKDTDGNVFGGYTQKDWGSPEVWEFVSDPAAFLISVFNPYGAPPMLFSSIGGRCSILRDLSYGPYFGGGIWVTGTFDDKCAIYVTGRQYANPTDRPAKEVMTGRMHFRPAIVEVYSL